MPTGAYCDGGREDAGVSLFGGSRLLLESLDNKGGVLDDGAGLDNGRRTPSLFGDERGDLDSCLEALARDAIMDTGRGAGERRVALGRMG